MKPIFLFILLLNSSIIIYAQENQPFQLISSADKIKIIEKIDLFQEFIKTENTDLIRNSISIQDSPHLFEKFIQLVKKIPKGNFRIDKVLKNNDNTYSIKAEMRPFGTPFIINLDKNFNFLNFDITKYNIKTAINDYTLEKNQITIPFHIVDGYMLVDGVVNGVKGKFMFDTGATFGLFLNNHFLNLEKSYKISSGSVSSGQALTLYMSSNFNIDISDSIHYENLQNIAHADFKFINEVITQDFMGFIGHDFIKNYEFVIDYDNQIINLYKIDNSGDTFVNYKINEPELGIMEFTTDPTKKQVPIIPIKIGGLKFDVNFDTGDPGTIKLDEITKTKMLQDGTLSISNRGSWLGVSDAKVITYSIKNIMYKNIDLLSVHGNSYSDNDKNHLTMGYQFLKNYISVWNYKKGTITLIKRQ